MKILLILLSMLTFFYGVLFTANSKLIFKIFGRLFLLFLISRETYLVYLEKDRLLPVEIINYEIFFVGIIIFAWVIITNERKIVNYISNNINLLNEKQYKTIVTYTSVILLVSLITFFIELKTLIILVNTKNFLTEEVFRSFSRTLCHGYRFWNSSSSIIYSLMYFLMYLKHDNLLNNLQEIKHNSYSIIYISLSKIKNDHEYFDNLVSLLPAGWLLNLFLGTSGIIETTMNKTLNYLLIVTCIYEHFFSWPIMLIFVINKYHSRLISKIECLKYNVAVEEYSSLDEPKGSKIKLLEQMANIHVTTASSLIKLDKGLILPLIGSICTYTFLFREKLIF